MEDTLIEVYCLVDEFCKDFLPDWEKYPLSEKLQKRRRAKQLSPSEIITLCIHFHQSHGRDFKHYYTGYMQRFLKCFFPKKDF